MIMNDTPLTGVRMGEGFRDELYAPLALKDYVTNESRLEHGKRVIVSSPRKAARSLTLEFQITGATKAAMQSNLSALYAELYKGSVDLEVPELGNEVFHLIYTGKTGTYSSGLTGKACKIKVSFDEPNPSDRA